MEIKVNIIHVHVFHFGLHDKDLRKDLIPAERLSHFEPESLARIAPCSNPPVLQMRES